MEDEDTIEALAPLLFEARRREAAASNERTALEYRLSELLGGPDDGSKMHYAAGWRLVVKRAINYTLDAKAWDAIKERVPEALRPVDYKPTPSRKGIKYLQANEPALYAICAEAITARTGKPAVSIERDNDDDIPF